MSVGNGARFARVAKTQQIWRKAENMAPAQLHIYLVCVPLNGDVGAASHLGQGRLLFLLLTTLGPTLLYVQYRVIQWGGHLFQPLESLYNINVLLLYLFLLNKREDQRHVSLRNLFAISLKTRTVSRELWPVYFLKFFLVGALKKSVDTHYATYYITCTTLYSKVACRGF